MRIGEINPFVRYAGKLSPQTNDCWVYSYDSRLFYIIAGQCTIETENSRHELSNGALVLFCGAKKYRFIVEDYAEIYAINFDFTQQSCNVEESLPPVEESQFDKRKITEHISFEDCNIAENVLVRENANDFEDTLHSIVKEFSQRRIYYGLVCGGMMKSLLGALMRTTVFDAENAPKKLDMIIEYIQKHYKENITNSKLGKIAGYHPYYINRLMMAYTHTTLRHYLINYRINVAKRLIINSDMTVAEVAEESGFKSVYYFSRCFKEKTGLSPKEFRKTRKNLI